MDDDLDQLAHIGIVKRSGRYPWGSGSNPYQRSKNFKSFYDDLKGQGMSDTEIAKYIQDYARQSNPHEKFTTTDLRANIGISTEQIRTENIGRARYLKDAREMSTVAIAEAMGLGKKGESTVRGWLKAGHDIVEGSIKAVAERLKDEVETKEFLDVGKGNNLHMGVTRTKFQTALARLRDEGYETHEVKGPQLGTDHMTNHLILTKPGVSWSEARKALVDGRLRIIAAQSDDGGITFRTPKEAPVSLSSKKLEVRYKEDGGAKMDGVIELRRGIPYLDLGENKYAQVRIAVDDTHFIKGMAIYGDDLPAGVDVRFNTNKTKAEAPSKLDALKPMKTLKDGSIDTDNPFGATVTPMAYVDKSGKTKTSVLNPVGGKDSMNVEGRWDLWSNNLSSQMLSKQPVSLAHTQLGEARTAKAESLAEIKALTNPVVKQKMLDEFADSADAAAVHLKAASLPRQSTHVLLPMNSMRPHEIYAPNYDNGDKVVLVRHPHGGPFEIPELTVNNKNLTARRILGGAKDAVGIHHTVAEQLSGADFDGDTVLVIPNPTGAIKTRSPLKELEGFDAKTQYKIPDDDTTTVRMTKKNTQTEMGKISNLITDMSIRGASDSDLAKAVKHSMVVIDAEKHGLDYKRSAKENNIVALKKEYQGGPTSGAATIISRASSEIRIPQVKLRSSKDGGPIDPKTGDLVWEPTGAKRPVYKLDKTTGKKVPVEGQVEDKTTKGSRMSFTKDARTLMSKSPKPMEEVYAAHANAMKDLASDARKTSYALRSGMPKQNPRSRELYSKEYESLDAKLKIALRNAPLERRAQQLAGRMARDRIDNDPMLDKDGIKKIKYQSLTEARTITGADKVKVYIEDREWEAIQAGALSSSHLKELLTHADMDRVKTLATPHYRSSLTPGQIAKAKSMAASGKPLSEIASALGIPRSTIVDNLANA